MIVTPALTTEQVCPKFPQKNIYRSRVSAHDASRKARAKTGERIRAYRCGNHWHMGHVKGSRS